MNSKNRKINKFARFIAMALQHEWSIIQFRAL